MADRTGKDQPPAYTKDDQTSTTGDIAGPSTNRSHGPYPLHTTSASNLRRDTEADKLTTSQYLELTFSVMVYGHGRRDPVVFSVYDDYDTLDDLSKMFGKSSQMKVLWGPDIKDGSTHKLDSANTVPMLRLLKSRSGKDTLMIC